jgi:glycosyltransferase involved in cell wall biosynthesis
MAMTGLRFCMATTFYPPDNFGGDGIAVQRLAEALVKRGHTVSVIHDSDAFALLGGRRAHEGPTPPDGLTVHRLSSRLGAVSPFLTQQLGRPIANGGRIRRIMDDAAFDVIHYHNTSLVGGPGLLGLGSALKLYTAHEHWLVCPTHVLWRHQREPCDGRECFRCVLRHRRPPQLWRSTGYLRRQLRHVDTFLAMSEFSREKHSEFGFPHQMEVLPPFLPALLAPQPTRDAEAPARPYFLFVGRLERMKGLDDVIPLFTGEGPDLLIAGSGDHEATLRALARGLPRVRFLGHVDPGALGGLYRHARGLIAPSVGFETFGMVLIEAFRHGTPVLARNIGPFPEIVRTARAGELFDDAEGLRVLLERWTVDDDHVSRLGERATVAFHARWTEEAVVPSYLDLVARAARRRGATRITEVLERG